MHSCRAEYNLSKALLQRGCLRAAMPKLANRAGVNSLQTKDLAEAAATCESAVQNYHFLGSGFTDIGKLGMQGPTRVTKGHDECSLCSEASPQRQEQPAQRQGKAALPPSDGVEQKADAIAARLSRVFIGMGLPSKHFAPCSKRASIKSSLGRLFLA